MESQSEKEIILQGIPGSPGVAHGPAYLFLQKEIDVPSYQVPPERREEEFKRFDEALLQTRHEIAALRGEIAERLGEEEARIFDAHLLVLEDKALLDETFREVEESGFNIDYCFHSVANRYIEVFANMDDEFIRERVSDIKDVTRRLLSNLLGSTLVQSARLTHDMVIAARDLTPSDTAGLEKGKVLAIVSDMGSRTSHAVIMARSIEVPAVVGLHDITERVRPGDDLLVDGYDGVVIINPGKDSLFRYGRVENERSELQEVFLRSVGQPSVTSDERRVLLQANIEGVDDTGRAKERGAEGVGLFRTEGIYLREGELLDEEEQYLAYRAVVEAMAPAPVVIRTLDLGGDKMIDNSLLAPDEDNPFMGFRAIRFCLAHPEIFKSQLRAILRAGVHGEALIMFPMISAAKELVAAKVLLEESKSELRERGVPFVEEVKVGSMIETPSAAYTADLIAPHCDFFSIGTNDLIQYMFAVDRVNDHVAHLYMPNHPAVIRTLKVVIDAGRQKGIPVGVCGEMAGDPLYAPLLLGLGADSLSMTPSVLPEIRFLVQRMDMEEATEIADKVLRATTSAEILDLAREYYFKLLGELRQG